MLKAQITGDLAADPERRLREDGKEFTTCRVLVPLFSGDPQMIHVACYQHDEGEKLRRLMVGDAVTIDGHLTFKHTPGRPSSVLLNVRHVTNANK